MSEPVRSHAFRLRASARYSGRVLQTSPPSTQQLPATLVDSVQGYNLVPRTLYLYAADPALAGQDGQFSQDRRVGVTLGAPGPQPLVAGMLTLEFQGLHPGGIFFRRFNLATFRQIRLTIEAFRDCRVIVRDQTGTWYDAVAIITDEPTFTRGPDPVFLSTRDTVAGQYLVPPGATSLISRQADPLFEWVDLRPDQAETAYPEVLPAGVPIDVRGSTYRTSLALLELNWRISLP